MLKNDSQGFRRDLDTLIRLAKGDGVKVVLFINPDQGLFDDNWFIDNCHPNEHGESVKAKILYRYLMDHRDENFRHVLKAK